MATRIQIATTVPPDSDAMAAFVVSMRALLAAASLATRDTALSVDLYLFGAYTSQAHESEMSQSSATEINEYLYSSRTFTSPDKLFEVEYHRCLAYISENI